MTTPSRTSGLEQAAFVCLVLSLCLAQLTIFGYVPLVVGSVLWIVALSRDGRRPEYPNFFIPLLALAAWTLVSSAFSANPATSFFRSRQLLYYVVVPFAMFAGRGWRAMWTLDAVIAVGGANALVGIAKFMLFGYNSTALRPNGLFGGHYMTYSGILMLVLAVAAARLIFRGGKWIWPAVAVPALLVAIVATYSRNAYLGTLLAITTLLVLKNWKLLIAIPALVAAIGIIAPASIRERALSSFDTTNATNQDRLSMMKSGIAMIKDHPVFGVGPNMVEGEYLAHYKRPDAVDPPDKPGSSRAHLHDVPIQLAAERGLPALAAWLWFVVVAGRDLFRQLRADSKNVLAASGLAVLVAAVAAGVVEHNFGDSEFLLLFLGLLTLPFAAKTAETRR